MNCQEFEKIVVDLARQSMIDAALRSRAQAHTKNCASCSVRLADEQVINASLKAAALEDRSLNAPAQIEADLLAAFRLQKTLPEIELPERSRVAWPWWPLAAAAAMILVFGLAFYRARQTSVENQGAERPEQVALRPAATIAPAIAATIAPAIDPTIAPAIDLTIAPAIAATIAPAIDPLEQTETTGAPDRRESRKIQPLAPRSAERQLQLVFNRRNVRAKPQPFLIKDGMTLYGGESGGATDFLPLVYSSNLPQMESGQLIRVKMPRSALVKFGLPVNVELSNIPVNADVLVGDDGMARAIRFVR